MPSEISPKKEETQLDQTEWDFSKCPEEQRRICCYYEYLRSLEPVRKLFKKYGEKDNRRILVDGTFILDELDALISLPSEEQKIGFGPNKNIFKPILVLIADIAEFPKIPWLQIPVAKRLTILKEYCQFVRVYLDLSSEDLESIAQSRKSHSDLWPEIVAVAPTFYRTIVILQYCHEG